MRRDRLDGEFRYALRRCPVLTDAECRLLAIVGSYEHGCLLNYDGICAITGWGRAKLKRTVKSLVSRGLIDRSYGCYKRTKLKIASAARQTEFAKAHDGSRASHELQLINGSAMAHERTHDGSSASHSILETELERKSERSAIERSKGIDLVPLRPGDVSRLLKQTIKSMNKQ